MRQHSAVNNHLASSIFARLATSKTRSRSRIPFECLSRPCTFSTGRVQLSRSTFPSSYVRQSREISSQHRTNTLHSSTSAPEAVTLSLNLFSSVCTPVSDITHYSSHSFLQLALISDRLLALVKLPTFDRLSNFKPDPSSQ